MQGHALWHVLAAAGLWRLAPTIGSSADQCRDRAHVRALGGGFGGLDAAHELRRRLPSTDDVMGLHAHVDLGADKTS